MRPPSRCAGCRVHAGAEQRGQPVGDGRRSRPRRRRTGRSAAPPSPRATGSAGSGSPTDIARPRSVRSENSAAARPIDPLHHPRAQAGGQAVDRRAGARRRAGHGRGGEHALARLRCDRDAGALARDPATSRGVSSDPSSNTLPSIAGDDTGVECRAMSTPAFTDGERPPVVLDGSSLTPQGVAAIARDGAVAVLSSEARAAQRSRARGDRGAAGPRRRPLRRHHRGRRAAAPTGCPRRIASATGSTCCAATPAAPGSSSPCHVVRAAMATRANQIGAGGAGRRRRAARHPGRRPQRRADAVHPRARLAGDRRPHQPGRRRAGPAGRGPRMARRRPHRRRAGPR